MWEGRILIVTMESAQLPAMVLEEATTTTIMEEATTTTMEEGLETTTMVGGVVEEDLAATTMEKKDLGVED